MQQAVRPAVAAPQLVVGQVIGTQLAAVSRLQVARLTRQIDAALGHDGGRKRRIAIRCNVEVIRLADFNAAARTNVERRRQQARFAFVAQRKADLGERQNRHVLEAHNGVGSHAHFAVEIEINPAGAEHPGRLPTGFIAAFAGGVSHLPRRHVTIVDEVETLGIAIAAVGEKAVARLREEALKAVELQLQLGAVEAVAGLVDAHLASSLEQVVGLAVVDVIGADRAVAAPDFGVAVNDGFQVGPARELVAKNKGRAFAAGLFVYPLGQTR